jgi:predicted MFS family arabinose efflux permease
MVTSSGRNVCAQAVASKIPAASERGSFMSLQAAVIHMSSAAGALVSSLILAEENGRLANMPLVAGLAILLTLMVPLLFARVERMIAHRGEITSSPPALPAVIE